MLNKKNKVKCSKALKAKGYDEFWAGFQNYVTPAFPPSKILKRSFKIFAYKKIQVDKGSTKEK